MKNNGIIAYQWHRLSDELPPQDTLCVLCSDTGYMKIQYIRIQEYIGEISKRMKRVVRSLSSVSSIWDENGLPKLKSWEWSEWRYWMVIFKPCKEK